MGSLDDFQKFSDRLQRELSKVDNHVEADRDHIKRFVAKMDGHVAESTLAEYLKNLRKTSERLESSIVDLTEADMDAHIYDLRHGDHGRGDGGLADSTIRNVEFAVRKYLTTVVDDDDHWSHEYELTPPQETTVSPDDMLTQEDISTLLDAATNLRDMALIEFLADSGARLTLAGTLRVGDVNLEGERATYTPNPNAKGLKGASISEYPIIDSRAAMRTYLNQTHPRPDDDDVAFFHKLPGHGNDVTAGDGAITPQTIRRQLWRAADRVDLEKPVNPHNFRHSAITRMRREGYDRAEVERRVHWTVDSDMWATYEHIAAEQHNDAIFARAGIGDAEERPDAERHPCGNCRETLAPHHQFCPRCGEPATADAREQVESVRREAVDELADRTAAEDVARLRRLLDAIDEKPNRVHEDSPSESSSR